ncbi:hypothetical protein DPMN_097925 [Dreissena polymorpha]|uniref:Uncharacterized protein n=1 Tax=Dreissena polymorpha TaxID=45954 RepID=A0A9D4R5U4_DREPO|nr:hypothetical protein DPMN_097925 [Dreissena polymorpha]
MLRVFKYWPRNVNTRLCYTCSEYMYNKQHQIQQQSVRCDRLRRMTEKLALPDHCKIMPDG